MSDDKTGWISINRSMLNHWIWKDSKELSKAEAWIYLLMAARHSSTPEKVLIKDTILWCNRGESLRSLETLSRDWNWNRSKVRRFLKVLEKDDMIRHTSETVTSRISICNYDTYQQNRNANETQVKQKRNANETHSTTNNNGNNENNENNDNKIEKPSHQLRAEGLFNRKASRPMDKAEKSAWESAKDIVELTTDEEWNCLEKFYAAPQSETYARKAYSTLLNNFTGEVSRAKEWWAVESKKHAPLTPKHIIYK